MRKLLWVCAVLYCGSVSAQATEAYVAGKDIICTTKASEVYDLVTREFQEQLVWTGFEATSESQYVLFVNPDTGTWTLVQGKRNVVCMLGAGRDSRDNKPKL